MHPSLVPRAHSQKEFHPQLAHPLAKPRAVSVHAVSQDGSGGHAIRPGLPDQFQGQLRLGAELHFHRHAHLRAPFRVLRPALRQIELAPTECCPCLSHPVSSTIQASSGSKCGITSCRIALQTLSSLQGLLVTNCCRLCESTPSRAAIGSIDLRCPGISKPST